MRNITVCYITIVLALAISGSVANAGSCVKAMHSDDIPSFARHASVNRARPANLQELQQVAIWVKTYNGFIDGILPTVDTVKVCVWCRPFTDSTTGGIAIASDSEKLGYEGLKQIFAYRSMGSISLYNYFRNLLLQAGASSVPHSDLISFLAISEGMRSRATNAEVFLYGSPWLDPNKYSNALNTWLSSKSIRIHDKRRLTRAETIEEAARPILEQQPELRYFLELSVMRKAFESLLIDIITNMIAKDWNASRFTVYGESRFHDFAHPASQADTFGEVALSQTPYHPFMASIRGLIYRRFSEAINSESNARRLIAEVLRVSVEELKWLSVEGREHAESYRSDDAAFAKIIGHFEHNLKQISL